jgi:ELWxxDGT repeat protein
MLLFNGYDANGNDGLWVSDGTASGIANYFFDGCRTTA